MPRIDKLAIVGLGLMGASLGLAARRRGVAARVAGYARRSETRAEALRTGVVDDAPADLLECVRGAALTVMCVPVLEVAPLVRAMRSSLAAGGVITDVGSTKAEIVDGVAGVLEGSGVHFVGSHPIAGSDETGLAAGRADLYENAMVVLTPPDGRATTGQALVEALWQAVGARVCVMTPAAHDQMLARTSHLPHLAAVALTRAVLRRGTAGVVELCGSGFRDTTRVAGGSEALWHDIVKSNREALAAELGILAEELECLRATLRQGDFEGVRRYLAEARRLREGIQPRSS